MHKPVWRFEDHRFTHRQAGNLSLVIRHYMYASQKSDERHWNGTKSGLTPWVLDDDVDYVCFLLLFFFGKRI
jgi:hypothetical protein